MYLKHSLLLILTFLICNGANAQQSIFSKKIGITFSSFGANEVLSFTEIEGGGSYDSKFFYTIGVNYLHPFNNWLEVETGIEYARHTISITPSFDPNVDRTPHNANFSLVNIPLTVKANFLKLFFVNGGILLDIDVSQDNPIDSQTGVGALLGIGAQYQFGNGVGIFVNPYTKMHALVPFVSESYHQRLLETGVRFGVTFVL